MWKSVLTLCLSLVLMLGSFSPVPAGSAGVGQDCDPQRLRVRIEIPEIIIGPPPVPDPAAETEMISRFREAGFTVVSRNSPADVIILGEGFGNITGRTGALWNCRARVEARAVNVADGTIIGAGDAEATARDISQQVGAKAALRNAGGVLADELILQIARHYDLCPRPRRISRASCAVIRFTAPGLREPIDFSTLLSDAIVMLGTVRVLVAGQDLEAVLTNAHAGIIPVPDCAIIGNVERAEIRNLAVVPTPLGIFYLNNVTLRMNVRTVDTETGEVLMATTREERRRGLDIVISLGGITIGIFNRTILGMMAREMLNEIAPEMAEACIHKLPPPSYFDTVTLINGDRFGDTVLNPDFTIVTSIGPRTFPTSSIRSIDVGNPSRITRTDGSEFTGQLLDSVLLLSELGAIPLSQVATVMFAIK
jgi:hypothetical protein